MIHHSLSLQTSILFLYNHVAHMTVQLQYNMHFNIVVVMKGKTAKSTSVELFQFVLMPASK
jgi:hypothetical protein